ncbi:MAG TPA: ribosome maturation factor RimP [Cyclobacteriaceae bacterium]|nr:ribosome maturation factor RimP [Cyclobacteriaceae bacterium]
MSALIKEIRERTEELLPGENYFVVDVSLTGGKGSRKLKILVDGDQGIDIDACSRISRELSDWLDQKEPIEGPFTLEVGSPGIDYPLSTPRQFRKNLGRMIKVLKSGQLITRGVLKEVDDRGIVIVEPAEKEGKEGLAESIDFGEILKATVIVSFK